MKNNRKEKIKVLQALRDGRLSIESLQPPQIYIFVESSTNPGVYTMKGKQYSETEYRQFCEKIRAKGNNSIIWNERKNYPKEDKIVTVPVKITGNRLGIGLRNENHVTSGY